jgi:penicillin V acylase-like amidase (Ntn superfamily)/Flp pilus assembly protein TadD
MKIKIAIFCFSLLLSGFLPKEGDACTTFCIHDKQGNILYGWNFDWPSGLGNIQVNQRGVEKTSFISVPEKPFTWTSKYGSISFNHIGREFPCGGMNEAGLVVGNMMLNAGTYPALDDRFGMEELQWIQYQLDVSATVEDVINSDKIVRVSGTSLAPLYFSVADAKGNFAIIEYLDGKMICHTGKKAIHQVLSNSTYDYSLNYYKTMNNETKMNIANPNGLISSADRFTKAAYMIETNKTKDVITAEYAFDILKNVSQWGTQWSVVFDLKRKVIYYKTKANSNIRQLDCNLFNYSNSSERLCCNIDADNNSVNDFKVFSTKDNYNSINSVWKTIGLLKHIPEEFKRAWAEYPDQVNSKTIRKFKSPATRKITDLLMKSGFKTSEPEIRKILAAKDEYYFTEPQLIELGLLALDNNRIEDALGILTITTEIYPESWNAHCKIGEAYLKQGNRELAEASFKKAKALSPNGEIKRSAANMINAILRNSNYDVAKSEVMSIVDNENEFYFVEPEINALGYNLLGHKRVNDAIEIFKINARKFPDSWNVFDSLGEAYMAAGNKELAVENYGKSLELNPGNENATEMLKKLNGK